MIFSLSKIIGIHSIHGIHMTTYSEKPLRILGLTVLLSISEHIVPFCPQKVYKRYTKGIHQVYIKGHYEESTQKKQHYI